MCDLERRIDSLEDYVRSMRDAVDIIVSSVADLARTVEANRCEFEKRSVLLGNAIISVHEDEKLPSSPPKLVRQNAMI